jgi:hypothetical protein
VCVYVVVRARAFDPVREGGGSAGRGAGPEGRGGGAAAASPHVRGQEACDRKDSPSCWAAGSAGERSNVSIFYKLYHIKNIQKYHTVHL